MNKNIKMTIMSSLEKLYFDAPTPSSDYEGFSMLQNEKKSFQVVIECDDSFSGRISVNSDLKNIRIFSVKDVKSDFPNYKIGIDDYFSISSNGYYPDLLLPIDDMITFQKGRNVFWIEIISNDEESIGNHKIEININDDDETLTSSSIDVEIIGCKLNFKDFIYTNWFHSDCLMSHYKIEAFSDEYWRIVKNYLNVACEYGMNCVLTPLFTPPLDTEVGKERPTVQLVDVTLSNGKYFFNFDKLTQWIEMAEDCGIKYFEMSHFYTQWGAKHAPKIMATVDGEYKRIFGWETKATSREYVKFLTEFSIELKKYLEAKNLKDRVMLHVSDEPNASMLLSYSRVSKKIHKLFEGYKIIDALSDYKFYKWKIVTTPIPANSSINKFIGKTDELWTYYCCSQHRDNVSNKFFCMPSLRNRILGYQMYKYNVRGFLHWGYNFWYTQFSKGLIDPFEVTDAGGKFPSGDPFVVYPKEDGTPYVSLRFKVFYDALQDMAALNTLESLIGREKTLAILEDSGRNEITFNKYPHSESWMLDTREKINHAIKNNIK